jgi:hypothetical protein
MLEICLSGYLILSVAVSVLLWRVLAAAKRADYGHKGIRNIYMVELEDGHIQLTKPIPSGND